MSLDGVRRRSMRRATPRTGEGRIWQGNTIEVLNALEEAEASIEAIQTAHLAAWCQDCQNGNPCPTVDAPARGVQGSTDVDKDNQQ